MVRNIGGYTRAFGSIQEEGDWCPPKPAALEPPALLPERQPNKRTRRYKLASREQAVGAIVGWVLDGQALPLEVNRYLLADPEREEAIRLARQNIIAAQDHQEVNWDAIEWAFEYLREEVVVNIRNS